MVLSPTRPIASNGWGRALPLPSRPTSPSHARASRLIATGMIGVTLSRLEPTAAAMSHQTATKSPQPGRERRCRRSPCIEASGRRAVQLPRLGGPPRSRPDDRPRTAQKGAVSVRHSLDDVRADCKRHHPHKLKSGRLQQLSKLVLSASPTTGHYHHVNVETLHIREPRLIR